MENIHDFFHLETNTGESCDLVTTYGSNWFAVEVLQEERFNDGTLNFFRSSPCTVIFALVKHPIIENSFSLRVDERNGIESLRLECTQTKCAIQLVTTKQTKKTTFQTHFALKSWPIVLYQIIVNPDYVRQRSLAALASVEIEKSNGTSPDPELERWNNDTRWSSAKLNIANGRVSYPEILFLEEDLIEILLLSEEGYLPRIGWFNKKYSI